MKMFRVCKGFHKIVEHEVDLVTARTVSFKLRGIEQRENITTEYHSWHSTRQGAFIKLKQWYVDRIKSLVDSIEVEKQNLAELIAEHPELD